jgi:hypothetical protein
MLWLEGASDSPVPPVLAAGKAEVPEPSVTLSSAAVSCLLGLGQTEPAYTARVPLRGQLQPWVSRSRVQFYKLILSTCGAIRQGSRQLAAGFNGQLNHWSSPSMPWIPTELRSPWAHVRPPLDACRVLMSEGAMYARAPTICVWRISSTTPSAPECGPAAQVPTDGPQCSLLQPQHLQRAVCDAMAWRRTWTR